MTIMPAITHNKERLIQDIREFVGPDGYVPFEHGYNPTMNASAIDGDGIILRWPIGREKRHRIEFSDMDTGMLINVILELFRYQNHCHIRA